MAFGSFVEDVVHIYYDSDKMVQEDEEIQAFVKDVCSFGMQDLDYCGESKLFTILCHHVLKYFSLKTPISFIPLSLTLMLYLIRDVLFI